jgi:hypothetical protein
LWIISIKYGLLIDSIVAESEVLIFIAKPTVEQPLASCIHLTHSHSLSLMSPLYLPSSSSAFQIVFLPKFCVHLSLAVKASYSEINMWEILNSLICLKIIREVRTSLMDGPLGCNTEECKQKYLHALTFRPLMSTIVDVPHR